jgi:RNA polymerase sigma factor (sigma-70 family)
MQEVTREPEADRRLVHAIQAEEPAAWDRFLERFERLILGVVSWRKWHFSADVQQDVAQQIRTGLLRAVPSFKGESSLDHYVKTIAVRQCIGEVRRQVRDRQTFVSSVVDDEDGCREIDFAADEIDEPVRAVMLAERVRAIRRLLAMVEPKCARIIRQFYMERISYKELAELHGISIKTVGSRLARCLRKLHDLSKKDPELREEILD